MLVPLITQKTLVFWVWKQTRTKWFWIWSTGGYNGSHYSAYAQPSLIIRRFFFQKSRNEIATCFSACSIEDSVVLGFPVKCKLSAPECGINTEQVGFKTNLSGGGRACIVLFTTSQTLWTNVLDVWEEIERRTTTYFQWSSSWIKLNYGVKDVVLVTGRDNK